MDSISQLSLTASIALYPSISLSLLRCLTLSPSLSLSLACSSVCLSVCPGISGSHTQRSAFLLQASSRLKQMEKDYAQKLAKSIQALQEKAEGLQRQLHSSEKKLLNKELEIQEQVTAVRQDCEVRIKGLLPAELQRELEDTITSLKAQVNFLQKRASLLQEDLEAHRKGNAVPLL
ncbi:unnamed protein product [Boreogadus saida]